MTKNLVVFDPIVENVDIRSSLRPFFISRGYTVTYPEVVLRALGALYREYNGTFGPLITANREWDTDYQYARAADGSPFNFAVQIDMSGLDDTFLEAAATMEEDEVKELLRKRIFEIENSIAMYHIFGEIFEENGSSSFKSGWRAALEHFRQEYKKPVALLACTHEKHEAMLAAEFDKMPGESLSDDEVRELSGFDRYFGPDEFRAYLSSNGGECEYLLVVRSSDPISKLKRPEEHLEQPLLSDPEIRRIIKMNALTFNIDDPHWSVSDTRRINDTKAYMPALRMAFSIADETDIYSPEFTAYLAKKGAYADFTEGSRFSSAFAENLVSLGLDQNAVENGRCPLRFKPLRGSYGCYGHMTGRFSDVDFRRELRKNLRSRGAYIVQQEIPAPTLFDAEKGYTYMDRIFFSFTNGPTCYLGGFRMLMPLDSPEAKSGRNHGSRHTIWAEIKEGAREVL